MSYVLTPAYGRDYKSKKELVADFNANKDFVANSFSGTCYINREQVEKETNSVQVRYKQNRSVCILKYNSTKQTWS